MRIARTIRAATRWTRGQTLAEVVFQYASPAVQAQIGVDHANKRQVREMIALGNKLRPDDDIDRLFFNHGDKFGSLFGRP